MFSRYSFIFFGVLFFVALVSSLPVDEEHVDVEEIETRNPALAIAVRVLKAAFKWAAKHCLEEAANMCKQHWKNPGALVNCARGFLESNKGRCMLG